MVPIEFDPNILNRLDPEALERCKKAFRELPKDPDWKTVGLVMIQWAEGLAEMLRPHYPDVTEAIKAALEHEPIQEAVTYYHETQRVLEMTILESMMSEDGRA